MEVSVKSIGVLQGNIIFTKNGVEDRATTCDGVFGFEYYKYVKKKDSLKIRFMRTNDKGEDIGLEVSIEPR